MLKLTAGTKSGNLVAGRFVNGQQEPLVAVLRQVDLHGVVEVLTQVGALVLGSSAASCKLPTDSAC